MNSKNSHTLTNPPSEERAETVSQPTVLATPHSTPHSTPPPAFNQAISPTTPLSLKARQRRDIQSVGCVLIEILSSSNIPEYDYMSWERYLNEATFLWNKNKDDIFMLVAPPSFLFGCCFKCYSLSSVKQLAVLTSDKLFKCTKSE